MEKPATVKMEIAMQFDPAEFQKIMHFLGCRDSELKKLVSDYVTAAGTWKLSERLRSAGFSGNYEVLSSTYRKKPAP